MMATQEITPPGTDRQLVDSRSASVDAENWDLPRLLLASFLTLFAELALIRWLAVEVRIFAYSGTCNAAVEITTDDWPYLHHEGHWIPRTYYSISILVLLIAVALYPRVPETRNQRPSLFFFAMGAGFLLLETQALSRLALFFGTIRQVSGIVIGALLTALLLANAVVDHWWSNMSEHWLVAGLLGGLLLAYAVPSTVSPGRQPGAERLPRSCFRSPFSLPVCFLPWPFAPARQGVPRWERTCSVRLWVG